MTQELPTKQPDEIFCRNCGTAIKQTSQFCPNCGTPVGSTQQPGVTAHVTAAGATIVPVLAGHPDRAELRRRDRRFTAYPVWLMATLSLITLGIFTLYWLNHWHGVMPKRRADDWSTARAIWCLFIPLYGLYWLFESLLRLCTRLDEELAEAGVSEGVPKELVRWFCITEVIPYVNLVVSPVLATIATAILQSKVNQLAAFDERALQSMLRSA